jgi:DeoR family glycerol-3-phosphate regulon repressor
MKSEKGAGEMNAAKRREAIMEILSRKGRASVESIASDLEMTPQTIRRDLTDLARMNKVVRFHGGASLLAGTEYTPLEARQAIAQDQKERIGAACANMIPDDVLVMINSGTTTGAVARSLAGHSGLRVVTDSVKISDDIKGFPGLEVMIAGGRVRPSDGAIIGDAAIEFLAQFRPDFAILGTAAIARDGALLDYDMAQVAVARAMMAHARNVILCADSSKFQKMAPVVIGNLEDIDMLVTDTRCSEVLRQMCQAARVRVVEA